MSLYKSNSIVRRGQAGVWWIINVADPGHTTLYWKGSIHRDGRFILSFNHLEAAQFDTKESAEFQATILGLPTKWNWRAEQHSWDYLNPTQ